ncbi:MAG: hypothetical protein ABIP14_08040 [Blastocatellia bacterium]
MFVQDNLENIEVVSSANFPNPKFLILFIGVIVCTFVLFAIGGPSPNILWQAGLIWMLLAMLSLLPLSASSHLMKLRVKS